MEFTVLVVSFLLEGIGEIFRQAAQIITDAIIALLNVLETFIVRTPYPQSSDGQILYSIDDGTTLAEGSSHWLDIYNLFLATRQVALILLLIGILIAAFIRIFDDLTPRGYDSTETISKHIKAMFFSYVWWPIAVALLAFSDFLAEATLLLTPETEGGEQGLSASFVILQESLTEITGSAAGEIAVSFAIILPMIFKLTLMVILLALWVMRYVVIYVLLPVMPLIFVLWAYDFPVVDLFNGIGTKAIKYFLNLTFLTFPAAILIVVFSRISDTLLQIITNQVVDSASSESGTGQLTTEGVMVLGDGASISEIATSLPMILFAVMVGMALAVTIPLIVAGGPFVLMTGTTDIRTIKNRTPAGKALNRATNLGGRVNTAQSDARTGYSKIRGSTGGGSAQGQTGSTTQSSSAGSSQTSSSTASGSTASSSSNTRMERAKAKLSDSYQRVNDLKQMEKETSAFEKAGMATAKTVSGSETLADNAQDIGEKMAEKGATASKAAIEEADYARKSDSYIGDRKEDIVTSASNLGTLSSAKTSSFKKEIADSIQEKGDQAELTVADHKSNIQNKLDSVRDQAGELGVDTDVGQDEAIEIVEETDNETLSEMLGYSTIGLSSEYIAEEVSDEDLTQLKMRRDRMVEDKSAEDYLEESGYDPVEADDRLSEVEEIDEDLEYIIDENVDMDAIEEDLVEKRGKPAEEWDADELERVKRKMAEKQLVSDDVEFDASNVNPETLEKLDKDELTDDAIGQAKPHEKQRFSQEMLSRFESGEVSKRTLMEQQFGEQKMKKAYQMEVVGDQDPSEVDMTYDEWISIEASEKLAKDERIDKENITAAEFGASMDRLFGSGEGRFDTDVSGRQFQEKSMDTRQEEDSLTREIDMFDTEDQRTTASTGSEQSRTGPETQEEDETEQEAEQSTTNATQNRSNDV